MGGRLAAACYGRQLLLPALQRRASRGCAEDPDARRAERLQDSGDRAGECRWMYVSFHAQHFNFSWWGECALLQYGKWANNTLVQGWMSFPATRLCGSALRTTDTNIHRVIQTGLQKENTITAWP